MQHTKKDPKPTRLWMLGSQHAQKVSNIEEILVLYDCRPAGDQVAARHVLPHKDCVFSGPWKDFKPVPGRATRAQVSAAALKRRGQAHSHASCLFRSLL